MVAVTSLSACAGSSKSARPETTKASSLKARATADSAAQREKFVAEAEDAVLAELSDAPIWEGTTAKGQYVSSTEVCVDRTYGPTGGLDGKGGNAGYVVVTFPGLELGEPQDGKCASAITKPTPETKPIEVPNAFKGDPGLITRDDLGNGWPLTVDFGALDCRTSVVDGITLQSVTFRVPNMQYALNGTANTHTPFPEIEPIWADDPDAKGLKIDISPLIDRGLARCK